MVSFIEFKWNNTSKKLTLLQRPRAEEELLLYCYNYRPDSELLSDYLAKQWIKDYTLASCKYMLGEARSKFATIAGPQGGSTLNGDTLKAEAQTEMEKLEVEVSMALQADWLRLYNRLKTTKVYANILLYCKYSM